MSLVQPVFWISGLLMLLEALYMLLRCQKRIDIASVILTFISTSVLFFGFACLISDNIKLIAIGPILIGSSAPLIPSFWLLFSASWGRDLSSDPLLKRNYGWFIVSFIFSIGLIIINLFNSVIQYIPGSIIEAYFQMQGGDFILFIFFLTLFLFGIYNIENCYRSAIGSQKQRLTAGLIAGLLMTVITFAFATLGIISHRLMIWAVLGLCLIMPVISFILMRNLCTLGSVAGGVVVTRRIILSSRIILTGGMYYLLVGILTRLLQLYGAAPDVLITIISGLLAVALLLVIIISNNFIKGKIKGQLINREESSIANVREFIEDISVIKTVDQLLDILKIFLRSNFGIKEGVYIEKFEADKYSIKYFNQKGYQVTAPYMAELFGWLLRYGQSIWFSDLVERTADSNISANELGKELGFEPSLITPVISRQNIIGILVLGNEKEIENSEELPQFIETAASPLGMAIQNSHITDQLIKSREMESFHKISSYVLHDLKNSVGMLDMLMTNARKNLDNPDFQQAMLRTISDAISRQRRIIARLTEPENEKELIVSEVDINKVLNQVIDKVQVRNIERINLEVELADLPVIKGNKQKIRSIVENLIVNAIEAMPVKGNLSIKTLITEDKAEQISYINVIVIDNGIGMSREFIENKLFKPFTSTKKKGLGIGMYQTYKTVKQMGGKLLVESEEGVGTTFTLMLPV
ncbi:MAG: ATP-binding protein [bacterium]